MNRSRREFLKTTCALAAGSAFVKAAAEPTLGMIFPPADYPVPPEAKLMYPTGVRFLALGVGLERMTPEGYDKVIDNIVPAAKKLAADGANAIALMGTSLSFYKGAAFNQQLADAIHNATGLPSTTMSTAVVEARRVTHHGEVARAGLLRVGKVRPRVVAVIEEIGRAHV